MIGLDNEIDNETQKHSNHGGGGQDSKTVQDNGIIQKKDNRHGLVTNHPFHLKRVTKILRQILEAKIQQNLCHDDDKKNTLNFVDILRFYSNTSYGATSVATMRRLDLFNAIRALSPHSHFISVMGRFLHVPETLPYEKDFEDLYCIMWSSFLNEEHQIPCNDLKSNGLIIQMNMAEFVEALKSSLLRLGMQPSPNFFVTVEQRMQSIILDGSDTVYCPKVDVDKAFFCILTVLEEFDNESKESAGKIFGATAVPPRVLSVMTRDRCVSNNLSWNAAENGDTVKDTLKALSQLRLLLNAFIIDDDQRKGFLPKDLFVKLISKWYSSDIENERTSGCEIELMASLFLGHTDDEVVDYIEYFCLIHSFVLEYSSIPTLKKTMNLMKTPHRGVELSHYEYTINYLHTVRLNRNMASFNDLDNK